MKLKLGIIFGIISWILICVLSLTLNAIISDSNPYVNMIVPVVSILVIGFFGILYIRNIEQNEVIEGFLGGVIFIIVDVVLDLMFFIIPNNINIIVEDYTFHLISTIILTLLITTFLGYLAQMKIDLK